MSIQDMSEALDIDEYAVSKRLEECGIKKRQIRYRDDLSETNLHKMYTDDGMTLKEIANLCGCSEGVVNRKIKQYGIVVRSVGRKRTTNIDDKTLKVLRSSGMTVREIANEIGCGCSTVSRCMRECGVV